jgi:hypothetical protein
MTYEALIDSEPVLIKVKDRPNPAGKQIRDDPFSAKEDGRDP